MLEKKFGDFLFDSLPDKSRTCPRYVFSYKLPFIRWKWVLKCAVIKRWSDFYLNRVILYCFWSKLNTTYTLIQYWICDLTLHPFFSWGEEMSFGPETIEFIVKLLLLRNICIRFWCLILKENNFLLSHFPLSSKYMILLISHISVSNLQNIFLIYWA